MQNTSETMKQLICKQQTSSPHSCDSNTKVNAKFCDSSTQPAMTKTNLNMSENDVCLNKKGKMIEGSSLTLPSKKGRMQVVFVYHSMNH